MFTSDKQNKKHQVLKTILAYLGTTLFCGLFSLVYEHFSHGVYSNYMVYLFLFPLIGGVGIFTAIGAVRMLPYPGRAALNLYHSGIATLTVGSCFQGVLDIYGTTSDYMPVYWTAGIILTMIGSAIYLFQTGLKKQHANQVLN